MRCLQCQHENRPSARFCDTCGHPIAVRCASCAQMARAGAVFCDYCGARLAASMQDLPSAPPTPQTSRGDTRAATRPVSDAERRHLTVMFCDLEGSTSLSQRLDPEDLREVVRAYQQTCVEVVQHFSGHIAQLLGDALLVYFGWPLAHEDDAQRAVHTGLGMLRAMRSLNVRLQQTKGLRLAIRLGIHTGLVVVGEMGSGPHREQLALGDTPNVASRLQSLAAPNTILIGESTYRLVQGYFTCDDLGAQTLRGVLEPIHVYRVEGESGARSRFDVAVTRGLTPLVGRELEVALLLNRWERVKGGYGQGLLLNGEAGIGKSRLVQVLKHRIAAEPHDLLECRSLPYYQNTALYPITELLQTLVQWQHSDTLATKQHKLERLVSASGLQAAEAVPLFASLLALPLPQERYPPLNLSPQRQRQRTLETFVALVLDRARHQPVILVVEDLHWTDPSTLELLDLLNSHTATASVLTLFTCRLQFQCSWAHSHLTVITLNRLPAAQIATMVECLTGGKQLPPEVLQQLVEKTDGVPLFIEEMTKAILEGGHLKAVDGRYEVVGSLPSLVIPATLQDSLMARLDRLVTAKSLAQLGATIGRQFPYALIEAIAPMDEATLQRELRRLVEEEILFEHGVPPESTYLFKHALIQDTAYQSLLKSTRQQAHQQIARTLVEQFSHVADTRPELLAHHYTEAGLYEQAVAYWLRSGQHSISRSAHAEAIAHLTRGLEVLLNLPDTPARREQELALQITLGPALMTTRGWASPEVEGVYARAQELCQQVGGTQLVLPVLLGVWGFSLLRAELQKARQLGEQCLHLAQQTQRDFPLVQAHYALGITLFWLGELPSARIHVERGIALYAPVRDRAPSFRLVQDPHVSCLSYAALALWMLGYPDQAGQKNEAMLTLARTLSHPFSMAYSLLVAAVFHQFRRDVALVQEHADATLALATEQGFPSWSALGRIMRGWALSMQHDAEQGIAQINQGLAEYRTLGAELALSYWLALLAEAYGKTGQAEAGLRVLAEAAAVGAKNGERLYEAELYRYRGTLLLAHAGEHHAEAEACFRQALHLARARQAKMHELRAAMSLSHLKHQQGQIGATHDVLAALYHAFTEGFDSPDLEAARHLLDDVS
jgi:predicted ATPase/class 3 adenylate cyclase